MAHHAGSEIPSWDGGPNSFEWFATACACYSYGLKDNERHLAAARIWDKMSGPAKGVVRHLAPEDFATSDGVKRLIEVLRESPLQKLPIPSGKVVGSSRESPREHPSADCARGGAYFTELQVSLPEPNA